MEAALGNREPPWRRRWFRFHLVVKFAEDQKEVFVHHRIGVRLVVARRLLQLWCTEVDTCQEKQDGEGKEWCAVQK